MRFEIPDRRDQCGVRIGRDTYDFPSHLVMGHVDRSERSPVRYMIDGKPEVWAKYQRQSHDYDLVVRLA